MTVGVEARAVGSAARFLDSLSVYCKLGLVYPLGNRRLCKAEEQLRAALAAAADPCGRIDFRFQGNKVVLAGQEAEQAGPAARWLKERFDRSGLAGLEIEAEVPADSLHSFAKALGAACQTKEKGISFARLWPVEYTGIRLLEAALRLPAPAENPDPQVLIAAETLAGNESIRARLDAILALLDERPGEQAGAAPRSPYMEVAGLLPAEALASPEAVLEAAERLLEEAAAAAGGRDLEQLARALGGGFFRREEAAEPPAPGPSRELGLRECALAGEIGPLLAGISALPDLPDGWSLERECLPAAEPLAAVMEIAVLRDAGLPDLQGQKVLLDRLLPCAGLEGRTLLRRHLAPLLARSGDGDAAGPARRLWGLLQEQGALLADEGLLQPAAVAATFPLSFFLFFDSLDLAQAGDRGRLQALWELLDEERLERAGPCLAAGLQEPARLPGLLEHAYSELMPLAGILFCRGEIRARGQAIRLLHRLELDPRASAALRLVGPAELLPPRYIWELSRALPGTPALGRARAMAGSILRSFLARSLEPSPARLQAISALGDYPGAETRTLLEALAKGGGFLGLFGAPRPEREAARRALQRLAAQEAVP